MKRVVLMVCLLLSLFAGLTVSQAQNTSTDACAKTVTTNTISAADSLNSKKLASMGQAKINAASTLPGATTGGTLSDCLKPADNECYPGGALAGTCVTDDDWDTGWYLARVNRKLITWDQVPAQFRASLIQNVPFWIPGEAGTIPGVTPSCAVTYVSASGATIFSGDWVAARLGQTNFNFGLTFAAGGPTFIGGSVGSDDTSTSFTTTLATGDTLTSASMELTAGGNLFMGFPCDITNI